MDLDIVIPTRNKGPRLELTLRTLAAQRTERVWRLHVVDDGDNGAACEVVQRWRKRVAVELIPGPRRGRAAARNAGASAGHAPVLLFIDDDILMTPGMLDAHGARHDQEPRIFRHAPLWEIYGAARVPDPAVGVPGLSSEEALALSETGYDPLGRRLHRNVLERAADWIWKTQALDLGWLCAIGANLSVRRTHFESLGGFDERFGLRWGCEDLEFGLRLTKEGIHGGLIEDARGAHLNHWRPEGREQHFQTHHYFLQKHDTPEVRHLEVLLCPDGSLNAYLCKIGRQIVTP